MMPVEGQEGDASGKSKQSRSVTVKKKKNILFGIPEPDVFKSLQALLLALEDKIEDLSCLLQTQAAAQFKAPDPSRAISKTEASAISLEDKFECRDIEVVMAQAGVSRPKAVEALKAADGDIVSAILALTD